MSTATSTAIPMKSKALDNANRAMAGGDPQRAVTYLRIALSDLEQRERIPAEAGMANASLGRLLHTLGDAEGGVFHLVRAVYLLEKAGKFTELYQALLDLASIHRARGEARLAMASRIQAGRLRASLASGRREGFSRVSMAEAAEGR